MNSASEEFDSPYLFEAVKRTVYFPLARDFPSMRETVQLAVPGFGWLSIALYSDNFSSSASLPSMFAFVNLALTVAWSLETVPVKLGVAVK